MYSTVWIKIPARRNGKCWSSHQSARRVPPRVHEVLLPLLAWREPWPAGHQPFRIVFKVIFQFELLGCPITIRLSTWLIFLFENTHTYVDNYILDICCCWIKSKWNVQTTRGFDKTHQQRVRVCELHWNVSNSNNVNVIVSYIKISLFSSYS